MPPIAKRASTRAATVLWAQHARRRLRATIHSRDPPHCAPPSVSGLSNPRVLPPQAQPSPLDCDHPPLAMKARRAAHGLRRRTSGSTAGTAVPAAVAAVGDRILDDHLLERVLSRRSWLEPQLLRRHHAQRRRAIHLERATSGDARRNVHPGHD